MSLDSLAEAYFEESLALNPQLATNIGDNRYNHRFAPAFLNWDEQRKVDRRYATRLQSIDVSALDPARRLTHDVLRWRLDNDLRSSTFPSHLQPINQFQSFHLEFINLGAGSGVHPFRQVKDYDDFLARMTGFTAAVDAAVANMRQGIHMGVVQPRILMERTLPQLSAQIVDDPERSSLYTPVRNMPPSFPAAERERLTAAYRSAISEQVVPAFQRLRDFIRDEYLPWARTSVGMSALPGGAAWYAQLVRTLTTTDLTPEQIHELGLREVARIHGEMEKVKDQVGFRGTLPEFFVHLRTDPRFHFSTREEMLAEYRAAKSRIDASTARLFDMRSKADYEIRPVEEFRERSAAGGSYVEASPDGSRPGIFDLNTYRPETRSRTEIESLLLHEGSPGHHLESALKRESDGLPRIQRFGRFVAYGEGWGLYAETLGKELGLYVDPYQYYGALNGELWRAIRLVLDTGIHAKGWTREQAIEYARLNSSWGIPGIEAEVERYIAIPGQALAYKIGQLKITELRRRAEQALGPRFDVKAFHREVLRDGALPLDVLEAKIDRWIASTQSAAGGERPQARAADQIAVLERRVEEATRTGDVAFLDSVYAPTFRFKHGTGQLEERAARLAALGAGRVRAQSRDLDSLDVEVHGDVALTTGRIHVRQDSPNPTWREYTIRYARVYVLRDGRWRLLTHHTTGHTFGPLDRGSAAAPGNGPGGTPGGPRSPRGRAGPLG